MDNLTIINSNKLPPNSKSRIIGDICLSLLKESGLSIGLILDSVSPENDRLRRLMDDFRDDMNAKLSRNSAKKHSNRVQAHYFWEKFGFDSGLCF